MENSAPQTPIPTPATPPSAGGQTGASNDTRTIVTVLCLLFIFPVGLILMWFWTKWKLWIKLLISAIPLLFILIGIIAVVILATINPKAQIQKANCVKQCQNSPNQQSCVSQCLTSISTTIQISPTQPVNSMQKICENNNGQWLSQYNECEGIGRGINKDTCESLGGTYFQCESACRHDQQATICNYGCVQVCKF